jgi:hypothetical protein
MRDAYTVTVGSSATAFVIAATAAKIKIFINKLRYSILSNAC